MFAQLQVTTPEGVTFKHDLAGAGSRSLATLIDLAIFASISFVFLFAAILSSAVIGSGFAQAGFSIAWFILLWGYRPFLEIYKSGSVGYKALGLTVVSQRGAKPLFWQCCVRGLLWPIEAVLFPLVGFISIITTSHCQRLGDLIAGTVVVHRNRDARLGTLRVQEAALSPDAPFRRWELSQVSDDEVFLIRRFLDRRVSLPPYIRLELANKLYGLIWPKVSGVPTDWYAEAVLEGVAASRAVANER